MAPKLDSATDPKGDTSEQVRRALSGDRQCLDWVVTRFSPLLEAQAAFRLGPALSGHVPLEDIVAEAWLVALERLRALAPEEGRRSTPRLVAFLGTTVLNIVNRRIERVIRRRKTDWQPPAGMPARDPLDDQVATITNAVSAAARSELKTILDGRLAAMDPIDRKVILLRIVEGLSNSDAAAELGESPNTVSHRYRRALVKLRAVLPSSLLDDFDLE